MISRLSRITLCLLALLMAFTPLRAQTPAPVQASQVTSSPIVLEASQKLDAAEKRLNQIEGLLGDSGADDTKLVEMSLELDQIARDMIQIGVSVRPRLTEIKARLDALGEAPAAGQPPEPVEVQQERDRLTQEKALINTLTGRAETLSIKASDLGDKVTAMRRNLFTEQLVRRTPINADFFAQSGAALSAELTDLNRTIASSFKFVWAFKFQRLMLALFLSAVACLVVLLVAMRLFGRSIQRDPNEEDPSYLKRLAVAFWSAVIPLIAAGAGFVVVLALMVGVFPDEVVEILSQALGAVLLIIFVTRGARAMLAPFHPNWRLIGFSNEGARKVYYLIALMVLVSALDFTFGGISETLGSPVVLTAAKSFVATILNGMLLIALSFVRPIIAESENPDDESRPWPKLIRLALILSGAGMIILSMAGYVGLSKFVSEQILVTGTVLALMYIGFQSAHEMMEPGNFSETGMGGFITRHFKPSQNWLDQAGVAFGLLLGLLVLCFGLPLILLQWGFQIADIQRWFYKIFTDIRIGGISISLTDILVGVLLFAAGLMATRYVQRWLDRNVMARSRMDPGLRNSIRTGVGYLGVAIAGLIGVVAAGINLSSLAIVAGALSLGIGFGLQNIVSNFVSGLILLAERPFKVGDWVETGTTQGFVKRISVRATEIETFQLQTIIVPNSELINGVVGNWNHRNSVARADVEIGVSYDADPERVLDILMEIATGHELVLRHPAPAVHFVNFGASSLDFVVKVFIADVLTGMAVKNDLRIAIYRKLKEEGIEIPFPQRDVNLLMKDIPEQVVSKLAAVGGGGRGKKRPVQLAELPRSLGKKSEKDDVDEAEGDGDADEGGSQSPHGT